MISDIKTRLRAQQPVTMIGVRYGAPALVEQIGALGFDAVFIDCEKCSFTFERVEEMCRAARAAGIASIVRPWSNDAGLTSRYLDIGADGVMMAALDDAGAARAFVNNVRYARYSDYDNKLAIGMIESPQAIAQLPSILEVPGIDAWFVGANDLAQRMGRPGGADTPEVRQAVDHAIDTIVQAGHVCGAAVDLELAATRIDQGVRFLMMRIDVLLASGTAQFRARIPPVSTEKHES
jgi:2-keto-3-deoxy-L-rhamnonate aldolase RhmA